MRQICSLMLAVSLAWSAPAFGLGCDHSPSPQASLDDFLVAFGALDWQAFRSCFSDDVSLFNPDIPEAISLHRLDGRAEVERSFRAVFDGANVVDGKPQGPKIVPEHLQITQLADAAIISFEFRRSQSSMGRRSFVFVRRNDTWLIVHIHASNVKS